jgi:hypothetical protein
MVSQQQQEELYRSSWFHTSLKFAALHARLLIDHPFSNHICFYEPLPQHTTSEPGPWIDGFATTTRQNSTDQNGFTPH